MSGRKMFRQVMFLALGLSVGGRIAEAQIQELHQPTNTVGYANCFGELQFTGHLGTVQFGPGEVYDLYYQYSSRPDVESPHLGRGFFVPLLESALIDHDRLLEVTTLGGATQFVYRLAHDPDRYVSFNGKTVVERLGDDRFLRTSPDGFKLEYRRGRLTRFITPRGAVVEMFYEGDVCRMIRGSDGGLVAGFSEQGANQVSLTTREGRFAISLQEYPGTEGSRPAQESGAGSPSRTVQSIEWPGGTRSRFLYGPGKEPGEIVMTMVYEDFKVPFAWQAADGRIHSAGDVRYTVSPLSRDWDLSQERIEAGVYTIRRDYPDGSWTLFEHDEDKGMMEETDRSGAVTRTHLIRNRGATFHLVKKRERGLAGSREERVYETVYRAYYDTEGQLLREVNEGVLVHHLRPGSETLLKDIPPAEDLIRYDEQDRIGYSRRNGTETFRTFLEGGIRRELRRYPWGEVNLRFVGPNGVEVPFPPDESFPEARDGSA